MPFTKTALTLILALALPAAVQALGLGDIHVKSALNEPLDAQVDIVGATADDIPAIAASIANRETFLRFGIERPAFLSTVAFRIAMDGKGRPFLAIRSTESFTEPLINMLIDLKWRGGELIREYTLLLDPVLLSPETRVAEVSTPIEAAGDMDIAKPAPRAPSSEPPPPAVANAAVDSQTVLVAAGATLRGIASRITPRDGGSVPQMMIAIYRANPQAFTGNMNRLSQGAVLAIPPDTEVSKVSEAEASREVLAAAEAARSSNPIVREIRAVPAQTAPAPAQTAALNTPNTPIAPADAAEASEEIVLSRRIDALESGLKELNQEIAREQATLTAIRAQVALAEASSTVKPTRPGTSSSHSFGAAIAAGALLIAGAVLWFFYVRLRAAVASREERPAISVQTRVPAYAAPAAASRDTQIARAPIAVARASVAAERSDIAQTASDTRVDAPAAANDATTTKLRALDANAATTPLEAVRAIDIPEETRADAQTVDTAKLQYVVLDAGRAADHVPMPSSLRERPGFKERRTSLVDVLKLAVQREPHRLDLRVKLLETYYAAAATGRQGFLEIVRDLLGERANMNAAEWGKIAEMGRQIAADPDLLAGESGLASYA
jgi:pilus assembly protein FimV